MAVLTILKKMVQIPSYLNIKYVFKCSAKNILGSIQEFSYIGQLQILIMILNKFLFDVDL